MPSAHLSEATLLAYCAIRNDPWYRRNAFLSGLRAAGHKLLDSMPARWTAEHVLLLWNRYGGAHDLALQVESAGGIVLIAENGYVGEGGGTPKFQVHPAGPQPNHYYALARSYHNGGGSWVVGEEDRLSKLKLDIKPWRERGSRILVCPNRAFGVPGRMMHPDWPERCAAKLKRVSNLQVHVRKHPGNNEPSVPLSADMADAEAVVIWSSSAGVHALIAGIPVICESPFWICKHAASEGLTLKRDDAARFHALQNMAWAQWSCMEIESGEPFRHLLPAA